MIHDRCGCVFFFSGYGLCHWFGSGSLNDDGEKSISSRCVSSIFFYAKLTSVFLLNFCDVSIPSVSSYYRLRFVDYGQTFVLDP
jgi:hypothetical protein